MIGFVEKIRQQQTSHREEPGCGAEGMFRPDRTPPPPRTALVRFRPPLSRPLYYLRTPIKFAKFRSVAIPAFIHFEWLPQMKSSVRTHSLDDSRPSSAAKSQPFTD